MDPNEAVMPITVLLVDDHPVFREGLESLVGSQDDMRVIGAVDNVVDAVARTASERPQVVLLDLRLAESSGLAALAAIKQLPQPPKVLIVSSHEGDVMVAKALRAGADGYVSKNSPILELLSAIRRVRDGGTPVSRHLARKVRGATGQRRLTAREIEIIGQVAEGRSNKAVGASLGLTEKTVKNHLNSIFAKLNASDRTHAVMIALERGIIRANFA